MSILEEPCARFSIFILFQIYTELTIDLEFTRGSASNST